jgi:hypothetical protein
MAEQGWRYLLHIFTEMELERELDELGSVGWELVSAHWEEFSLGGRSHMQARCILKRPSGDGDEFDESDGRYEPLGVG